MNINELIKLMRKRPGMFTENSCLEEIAQFIGGFIFANSMSGHIEETDIIFKEHFHKWVKRNIEIEYNMFFSEDRNYVYYIKNSVELDSRISIFFDMCDKFFEEYREQRGYFAHSSAESN